MEDPDSARRFVRDVTEGMERRMVEERSQGNVSWTKDDDTPMKRHYGRAWSYFFGIVTGIDLMQESRRVGLDVGQAETTDHGLDDRSWQEHYDVYGYGSHGRGLEVGKRLAVYSGNDFTFVEPDETDDRPKFTFTE